MSLDQKLRDSISALINSIDADTIHQYRLNKIHVYSYGLKNRIAHTNYAIEKLSNLIDNMTNDEVTKEDENEIYFYSDSFWGFLYSTLDIFAQLVNQIMDLGLDEEHISFANILNHLNQTEPKTSLTSKLLEIKRSNAYKNALKYRHCLTHRRSIALKRELNTQQLLGGYNTSVSMTDTISVNKNVFYTCDNPMSILNPIFTQA